MQKLLVVVDMQNDFIDGALGTKEALSIVPNVKAKIENFEGTVLFTRDTHMKTIWIHKRGTIFQCHIVSKVPKAGKSTLN